MACTLKSESSVVLELGFFFFFISDNLELGFKIQSFGSSYNKMGNVLFFYNISSPHIYSLCMYIHTCCLHRR